MLFISITFRPFRPFFLLFDHLNGQLFNFRLLPKQNSLPPFIIYWPFRLFRRTLDWAIVLKEFTLNLACTWWGTNDHWVHQLLYNSIVSDGIWLLIEGLFPRAKFVLFTTLLTIFVNKITPSIWWFFSNMHYLPKNSGISKACVLQILLLFWFFTCVHHTLFA